jgi:hypothetical protein
VALQVEGCSVKKKYIFAKSKEVKPESNLKWSFKGRLWLQKWCFANYDGGIE